MRPALRSAAICWPGKMSATATRPLRYAGSEIAPTLRSSFASVAAWKNCFSAITVPEVPFGIRLFATSTGVGAGVVDARAVLDEVRDQQDRRQRRRGDAERERPAARLRDLGGEEVFDTGEFLLGFLGRSSDERSPHCPSIPS